MTQIHLPDELARELMLLTGQAHAPLAVQQIAQDYVQERRERQREVLKLAGTFDFDPEYDYKAQRNAK